MEGTIKVNGKRYAVLTSQGKTWFYYRKDGESILNEPVTATVVTDQTAVENTHTTEADSLPRFSATPTLHYILPETWRSLGQDADGAHGFETSFNSTDKRIGFIRSFDAASHSIRDWAELESQKIAVNGITITAPPTAIKINEASWMYFMWDMALPYHHKDLLLEGARYYASIDGMMIEVLMIAPKETFGHTREHDIINFLSTVTMR